MITALLIFIGIAMIAGGFYSMSRHEEINERFYAETAVAFFGIAVIGAAFVRVII